MIGKNRYLIESFEDVERWFEMYHNQLLKIIEFDIKNI